MRIALISDIHGNQVAFDAVLADIEHQRPDRLIFLGDSITIGPQPLTVLEKLRSLDCDYVMGNHDAALLDLEHVLEYRIASTLVPTIHWCAEQLEPADLDFLRGFVRTLSVPLGGDDTLFCYHGSPQSNTDLILATTPGESLDWLFNSHRATIMAGGHTHIQMLRQHHGTLVVNPGSVGNAFVSAAVTDTEPELLPWAEYAIIEWIDGHISVDLRRLQFDIPALIDVLEASALPIKEWWLQQYRPVIKK